MIRPLLRLILGASSFFCPDSVTIETHFHYLLFFLSRFGHYRDTYSLTALFSVPIQPLSRLIFTTCSSFCPDSPTIETHTNCQLSFLSRFGHYRDTYSLLTLLSVPIRPLSRHILIAHSSFCPDSPTIETHTHCQLSFCPNSANIETYFHYLLFFLSRFGQYRDSFSLPALLSVPIRPLSRHILIAHSSFCPDSANIETHFH